ncbi:hypothetical protein DL93DRAFT_321167 [Clavulina sp. PMI_390]|nr:hypothetical protein DL93DRAFT_321167 [Clavulina sp. PMI_390]
MESSGAYAAEREPASLRTLRRLSSSHGHASHPLDPDLPIPRVPAHMAQDADSGDADDDASSEGSHLFWLPAHLHPELAPAEFRAFLAEHTSSAPSSNPAQPLARSLSRGNTLGRQKSMLSRQYRPSANDGVENEDTVPSRRPIQRAPSQSAPGLSSAELQALEAMADEAVRSGDPTRLRSVLKRSISMNHTSVIDQMDNINTGDSPDEPLASPQPSQSLKRTTRTKIRKSNLQGTGGGHRFASTRRGRVHAAAPDRYIPSFDDESPASEPPQLPHTSSSMIEPPRASFGEHEDRENGRPLSYSEEAAIFDSYADRGSFDQDEPVVPLGHQMSDPSPYPAVVEPVHHPQFDPRDSRPASAPPAIPSPTSQPISQPQLYHPTPQHHLPVPSSGSPARSPSPSSVSDSHTEVSSIYQPSSSPGPSGKRPEKPKEKEKKGGLFSKSKKKEKEKEKEKPKDSHPPPKEKDSSFFGSLFGKKKTEESSSIGSGQGPATAAALLGQSRSKATATTPEPPGPMGYARYPIHVERAVYRLSHIKLANPRRPLHEQVLISNLMFWYLGIINKPATPQPAAQQPTTQPQPQQQPSHDTNGSHGVAEREDQERAEQADRERYEREQRAAAEREQRERELQEQARREQQQPARKGLNKASASGVDPRSGARKAEVPVKGPQYGIGAVMDQGSPYEMHDNRHGPYDAYSQDGPQQQQWPSAPANQQYRSPQQRSPPPTDHAYQDQQNYQPSYNPGPDQPSPRNSAVSPPPITRQPPRSASSLPPGAMPPMNDSSQSWVAQNQQGMPQGSPQRPPMSRNTMPQQPEYDQFGYNQAGPPVQQRQRPQTSPSDHRGEPTSPQRREQRSPPPQQQQQPGSLRTRTPSYNASNGKPILNDDSQGAKLQGRSLSASAVPTAQRDPRSRSPPPGSRPRARSRSRTREEGGRAASPPPALPANGGVRAVRPNEYGSREEEDLPLAVYQRQHQQQYAQQHPYQPQPQPQSQYYPQQYQQIPPQQYQPQPGRR